MNVSGQLETDLTASAADIVRAVAEEQRQAAEDAQRAADERQQVADQQILALREEIDQHRQGLQDAAAARAESEQTIADLRRQLDTAQQSVNDAQRERESLTGQLEQSRRDEEQIRRELQDLRDQTDRDNQQTQVEADERVRELASVREQLANAARLASALRTLDEATSLGDTLDRLAQSACQESDRTAVFLVKGERIRGWRALGFDNAGPIIGPELAPDDAGIVGRAVRTGVGQPQDHEGDEVALPAFAATDGPRDAIAVPVRVGGSVIAVLYADAVRTDTPEGPEWVTTIDRMATHAGRVLEAMTVRQAAARWSPRPPTRRAHAGGRDGSSSVGLE